MLHEDNFPTVEDIYEVLRHLPAQVEPEFRGGDAMDNPGTMDVRLQVYPDGQWVVRTGSAQFDQDGRGFWGSSSVSMDDTDDDMRRLASDLREQAIEDCAMAGELEEIA